MSSRVREKLEELTMGSQIWIEGNPVLEPVFNKGRDEGRAEGEARGRMLGKAEALEAPDSVLQAIRDWPVGDLAGLAERVNKAIQARDWSELEQRTGPGIS